MEQLLADGQIASALLLKGDFTDEERLLIQQAYEVGLEHGRAFLLDEQQEALEKIASEGEAGEGIPDWRSMADLARAALSRSAASSGESSPFPEPQMDEIP